MRVGIASLCLLLAGYANADWFGHFSRANCVNNESITFMPGSWYEHAVISWHYIPDEESDEEYPDLHFAGDKDPIWCSSFPNCPEGNAFEDALCVPSDNCLWPLTVNWPAGRWAAIHSVVNLGLTAGKDFKVPLDWAVEGRHTIVYGWFYGIPIYQIFNTGPETGCNAGPF